MTDWRNHPNPTAIYHANVAEYMEKAAAVKDYHVFADSRNRLLPIDSPEALVASAAFYFGGHSKSDPSVEAALVKSAAVFGLSESVKTIKAIFEEGQDDMHKSAASNAGAFAYDRDGVQAYDVSDNVALDASAVGMLQDLHEGRIPPAVAREAAVNMVKMASGRKDVTLPARVKSLGASHIPDWKRVERLVRDRRRHGYSDNDVDFLEQCVKTASAGEFADMADRITPDELVACITSMDTQYQVKYAACATPEEIVFCGEHAETLSKMASAFHLLGGTPVPAGITASIKPEEWQRALDSDDSVKAEELTKRANASADAATDFSCNELDAATGRRILGAYLDIVQNRV